MKTMRRTQIDLPRRLHDKIEVTRQKINEDRGFVISKSDFLRHLISDALARRPAWRDGQGIVYDEPDEKETP